MQKTIVHLKDIYVNRDFLMDSAVAYQALKDAERVKRTIVKWIKETPTLPIPNIYSHIQPEDADLCFLMNLIDDATDSETVKRLDN